MIDIIMILLFAYGIIFLLVLLFEYIHDNLPDNFSNKIVDKIKKFKIWTK